MKTRLIIGILAIIIFVVGAYFIWNNAGSTSTYSDNQSNTMSNTPSSSPTVTPTPSVTDTSKSPKTYTMADVKKHATANSCWTAVNGNVYDVTKWIDKHPGGKQAIIGLCGIDGSGAFNDQHGGQRRPAAELATFLIGSLSK